MLVLCWFVAALAAVPDRAPAPIALTPEEQDLVARREIATRFDPGSANTGGVVGVIDVAATVDATWRAILDVEARVGEISGLSTVRRYLDDGRRLGARWEARIVGQPIVFHVVYELDAASRFIRFHLDSDQTNDIAAVQGAYQLYAAGGATRLVYWSETDSGRPVPSFVKRWLASDALAQQLTGIRARAEARSGATP